MPDQAERIAQGVESMIREHLRPHPERRDRRRIELTEALRAAFRAMCWKCEGGGRIGMAVAGMPTEWHNCPACSDGAALPAGPFPAQEERLGAPDLPDCPGCGDCDETYLHHAGGFGCYRCGRRWGSHQAELAEADRQRAIRQPAPAPVAPPEAPASCACYVPAQGDCDECGFEAPPEPQGREGEERGEYEVRFDPWGWRLYRNGTALNLDGGNRSKPNLELIASALNRKEGEPGEVERLQREVEHLRESLREFAEAAGQQDAPHLGDATAYQSGADPSSEAERRASVALETERQRGEHSERPRNKRPGDHLPMIMRHVDGGFVWTDCESCGPNVAVDEDGCCQSCGIDALHYGNDPAPRQEASGDGLREAVRPFAEVIAEIDRNALRRSPDDEEIRDWYLLTFGHWRALRAALDAAPSGEGVCWTCASEMDAPPGEGEQPFRVEQFGPGPGYRVRAWTGDLVENALRAEPSARKVAATLNRLFAARPSAASSGEGVNAKALRSVGTLLMHSGADLINENSHPPTTNAIKEWKRAVARWRAVCGGAVPPPTVSEEPVEVDTSDAFGVAPVEPLSAEVRELMRAATEAAQWLWLYAQHKQMQAPHLRSKALAGGLDRALAALDRKTKVGGGEVRP